MKKSYYIGIAFLVFLGLAISLVLRPGNYELGLMNLQEKRYEQALKSYEARYESGDRSSAVVVPLSKLYLEYGDIRTAITIMERFVQENPNNAAAWQQLATLYRYDQQRGAYIHALEAIIRLAPTADMLKELADAYHDRGEYGKQIAMLESLRQQQKATPTDIMVLVYLYVSHKDFSHAVATIHTLKRDEIKTLSPEIAMLICSVLIDAGNQHDAVLFAKHYVNLTAVRGRLDDDTISRLSTLFLEKGDTENALALLSPLTKYMQYYPRLLAAFAKAERAHGNTDKSFALMLERFRQKKLETQFSSEFVESALARKQYALCPEMMAAFNNQDTTTRCTQALSAAQQDKAAYNILLATLKDPHFKQLPANEKRDIAFMLLEQGRKSLAEPLFFELAQNAPPSSPDVARILYLFGPEPPEYGQQWLIQRAKNASGNEQISWFTLMNNVGMNETVITLAEHSGQKQNDAYIEALLAARQYNKAADIVQAQLAHTQDTARIKKLTHYALQAGTPTLAASAYRKRYDTSPQDDRALKELILFTYAEGQYADTKTYLDRYLAMHPEDYLMQYYRAELYRREKNYSNAKLHYTKAIELIVATQVKDTKMNMTHALSLYRLGDKGKSLAQFKHLIIEEPSNTELRESFANILIEGGRYREAEEILSGEHIT